MAPFRRRLEQIGRQLRAAPAAAAAPKPDGKASAGTLLPEDSKKKQIFSLVDLQAGDDAFYNVPTLLEGGEALLDTRTGPIAAATAPRCMHYDTPPGELPLLWTRAEWEALAEWQAREPIFDMEKVAACFNREVFERDGYVVWRGIMTDDAQRKWTKVKLRSPHRQTPHPHRGGRSNQKAGIP